MEPKDFGPEDILWMVEAKHMRALKRIASRLFSENRMTGDDMRDAAQTIDAVLEQSFEYGEGFDMRMMEGPRPSSPTHSTVAWPCMKKQRDEAPKTEQDR